MWRSVRLLAARTNLVSSLLIKAADLECLCLFGLSLPSCTGASLRTNIVSHQLEAAVWAEEWNGWLKALYQRQLGNQSFKLDAVLQTGLCLKLGARVSCTSLTARLQGSENQEADSSTACASWIL